MNNPDDNGKADINEIELFTFNLMDICFGIDTDQISEIYELKQAKQKKIDLHWFHEKIAFQKKEMAYVSPKVVVIKDAEMKTGIVIDRPDNIAAITIDAIQPMPVIFESFSSSSPIWGVVLDDEKIILLVDSYRLVAGNR